MQALFSPMTVIRDADIINHADLLDMLERNSASIRAAFLCGALALGIRDSAESLSEINESIGEKRASPEMYAKARERLPGIESWLAGTGLPLVETSTATINAFREHLDVVLDSGALSPRDEDILRPSIEIAREASAGNGPLRFGDVIREVRSRGGSDSLIQWCRAAHVLVAPRTHGIPPSTADQDLRPEMVTLLCLREGSSEATRRWADLYPRKILTEDALMNLSFDRISVLRSKGYLRYFDAVKSVQLAFGTPAFDSVYGDYLAALAEYIEAIGEAQSAQMVDWQKALLDQRVEVEEEKAKGLLWAIPIMMLSSLELMTMTIAPGAVKGLAEGVERLRASRSRRSPGALLRLKKGTTVTPVAPRDT